MYKNKKNSDFYFIHDDSDALLLTKYCEWNNCEKKGEYKAPSSRSELRVFKYFCLEHVKQYNKGWDYFKGRTTDQIYKEVSKDATWHRPTWKRIKNSKFSDLYNFFDLENKILETNKITNLSKEDTKKVLEFLKILNMEMPDKLSDLKKQYKLMVKKFHPDINKNSCEENIVKLNNAYANLLTLLNF